MRSFWRLVFVAALVCAVSVRAQDSVVVDDDAWDADDALPDVNFVIDGKMESLYNMTLESVVVLFITSPASDDTVEQLERELLMPLYDKYCAPDSAYNKQVQESNSKLRLNDEFHAHDNDEEPKPQVRIISVGQMQSLDTQERMTQFAIDYGFKWSHVANTDAVARKLRVNWLPVLFIIDEVPLIRQRLEAEDLEVASASDLDTLLQQVIADPYEVQQTEEIDDWNGFTDKFGSDFDTATKEKVEALTANGKKAKISKKKRKGVGSARPEYHFRAAYLYGAIAGVFSFFTPAAIGLLPSFFAHYLLRVHSRSLAQTVGILGALPAIGIVFIYAVASVFMFLFSELLLKLGNTIYKLSGSIVVVMGVAILLGESEFGPVASLLLVVRSVFNKLASIFCDCALVASGGSSKLDDSKATEVKDVEDIDEFMDLDEDTLSEEDDSEDDNLSAGDDIDEYDDAETKKKLRRQKREKEREKRRKERHDRRMKEREQRKRQGELTAQAGSGDVSFGRLFAFGVGYGTVSLGFSVPVLVALSAYGSSIDLLPTITIFGLFTGSAALSMCLVAAIVGSCGKFMLTRFQSPLFGKLLRVLSGVAALALGVYLLKRKPRQHAVAQYEMDQ